MAQEQEANLAVVGHGEAAGICEHIAAAVDERLTAQCKAKLNVLKPCDAEYVEFKCGPAKIPSFAPWISIRWGDSKCDCIEGDDTEIMCLRVCNPYNNITLSNLVVHQIRVVDPTGAPVPTLPDGSPSVQLVPIGPYCFGDIAPCSCVQREFVLRLRGAKPSASPKPYRILIDGICFDACVHAATRACFEFNVCKD